MFFAALLARSSSPPRACCPGGRHRQKLRGPTRHAWPSAGRTPAGGLGIARAGSPRSTRCCALLGRDGHLGEWALKKGRPQNLISAVSTHDNDSACSSSAAIYEYMPTSTRTEPPLTGDIRFNLLHVGTGSRIPRDRSGLTMRIVILFRCVAGATSSPAHHFGFEAVKLV